MKTPGIRILSGLLLLSGILIVSCQRPESPSHGREGIVILPAGTIHEGWYFAAGDQVSIEGTVNGDAYVAGGLVTVDGIINGDLLVAGGQIIINGRVTDDVRSAGGTIECNGSIGRNLTAAGGTISVGKPASVGGGVLAAGGDLRIGGTIGRDAVVVAGMMTSTGRIVGDVSFTGGGITLPPGAEVGGNLTVLVSKEEDVEVSPGTVRGTVNIRLEEEETARTILGFPAWHFWMKIFFALSLLATALVLSFVAPRPMSAAGTTIVSEPGQSILWGFIGVFMVPVASCVLLVTLVGAPLGLLVCVLYLWLVYLSQMSFGVALGLRMAGGEARKGWRLFGPAAVGIIILQGLTFIPVVRYLVIILSLLFGLGASLIVLWALFRHREGPATSGAAA